MRTSLNTTMLAMACALLTANPVQAENESATAGGHARVRFFGQAVIDLAFYPGSDCIGGRAVSVSRSGLRGGFGNKSNLSLGMPETPDLINLEQRDGFLAKAFYREYVVDAGKPLAIQGSQQQTTRRYGYACGPIGVTFVPGSGKDYEVAFNSTDGMCRIDVAQIDASEGDIKLLPVLPEPVRHCSASAPNEPR